MCEEKTLLLLKSLPQKLRRHCVPLPDYAKSFLERKLEDKQFGVGDFLDSLISDIRKERGLEIKRTDFRPESSPLHSSMNFRLIDEHGRQLEVERNLVRLRSEYGQTARSAFQAIAQEAAQVELGVESPVDATNAVIAPGILASYLKLWKSKKAIKPYLAIPH